MARLRLRPAALDRLPAVLVRAEGLAVFGAALAVYFDAGYGWPLLALLALAPDVSMLGYLAGTRVGAASYNAVHTYVLPIVLGIAGVLGDGDGADRLLGYGLKYPGAFQDTHLQRL